MKLIVRLTPKASHNKIEGWIKDEKGRKILHAKVTEIPEKGKANTALINLLIHVLRLSQSQISLVRGARGRIKQLEIEGEEKEIEKKLNDLCG